MERAEPIPAYRYAEMLGILGFFVLLGLLGWESWRGFQAHSEEWSTPALAALCGGLILGAVLVADTISGLFHFLADNFGTEETPIFGPYVIGPFREHHVDPRAMTKHGFVETNGNSCLICVPAQLLVYFTIPAPASIWFTSMVLFVCLFTLLIFLTNQFHKWSHLEDPPLLVGLLQRTRLILSPVQHQVHHTPPFDRYYCITTGWMNPPLDWVGFFPRLERVLRWITRSPSPVT